MGSEVPDKRNQRGAVRILIVEDEEPVRIPMVEFMRLRGYHVDSVANGHEGLEALGRQRYEACIVDLLMPGMNGEEFMMEARRVQPHLKYVVITGKGMSVDREYRRIEKSPDVLKILQKPFPLEKLNQIMEETFRG